MMKYFYTILSLLLFVSITSSFAIPKASINGNLTLVVNDSVKNDSIVAEPIFYKKSAHASYYHDKFNGRKTASGQIFSNNLYTAAHKKLKFGTKLKVTNTVNGKYVIVTVNDRGPFIKGREIDLSKKAFMEIAKNKRRGVLIVDIEIIK